ADALLRGVDLLEDAKAVIVIATPCLGDDEVVRRAEQEGSADGILQRGELAAHGRQRQTQVARCSGEAARLDDAYERRHLREEIHRWKDRVTPRTRATPTAERSRAAFRGNTSGVARHDELGARRGERTDGIEDVARLDPRREIVGEVPALDDLVAI